MLRFIVFGFMALLIFSCASEEKASSAASAESPAAAKAKAKEPAFKLREYREEKLANGLTILFLPDNRFPSISMNLMFDMGANVDPKNKEGLNEFVAGLIGKGTADMNATEVAEQFEQLGASFSMSGGWENTGGSVSGLSIHSMKLMDLFYRVVVQPKFDKSEIERLKSQKLARFKQIVNYPNSVSAQISSYYLNKGRVFGRSASGTPATVKGFKRRDIIRHYLRYFRPNNATLAVVGRFDAGFEIKVKAMFSEWEKRDIKLPGNQPVTPLSGKKLLLVDKEDLQQTSVRISHHGIFRNEKDFFALRAANTVLGGAFVSRLNTRIRDDLGLTYGIGSRFSSSKDRGTFTISAGTKHETAGRLVSEALSIYKKFKADGITQDELNNAKALMKGRFPQAIETTESLAYNLLLLRHWGVDDDYLKYYIDTVNALTLDEVNAAIKKHFDPENLQVVMYTSKKAVENQVLALGIPAEVRPYKEVLSEMGFLEK